MAILAISFWAIITHSFMLKTVEAKFSCKLLDGVKINCKYDLVNLRVVLRKELLPISHDASRLVMSSCSIEACDVDIFEKLPLLQHIDISSNYLDSLANGTFDTVPQLEKLDLSDNNIDYLPANLFQRNHKLEHLILTDNLLQNLEIGLFNPLVYLQHLDLDINRLQGRYIHNALFFHNVNIEYINFSNNDMSETPPDLLNTLNYLRTLILNACHLEEIPSFLMAPNLKTINYLSLKNNRITKIGEGVLDHLYNLETLELSYNRLEYINEYSLRNLRRLNILSLSRNLLTTVPQRLFRNIPDLPILDLSRNKISSLPEGLFKKTNVLSLNVSHNKLTYLQYNFCKQQPNSKTFLLFFFHRNPWQCACLRELLGEVKDLKIIYDDDHFDGGMPVCVTTNEFICKRDESLNSFYVDLFNSSSGTL